MAMVNLDGVDLPAPTKYKIPDSDLDSADSNRNELGYFQRDRVRQGVLKAELEFKVNSSDLALIKSAVKPPEIQATLLTEVGFITRTMYAGDRNTEMLKYSDDYNKIMWSISFNLIEC